MTSAHRRIVLPVAAGGLTFAALLFPVRVAEAQSTDTTVSPSAEAWYRPLPGLPAEASSCDLPTGCAPAVPEAPVELPSQYPAGTLHVGISGGLEESRTYLTLDLATIPTDQIITGGTLTLPLATEPEAGTVAPDTATLRACLVEGFVIDGVEGDATGAPATDCSISSDALYTEAIDEEPAVYRIDLQPFADSWSSLGAASLVLVPGEAPAPSETWHAAFSRRDREGAAESGRIIAELQLESSDDGDLAVPETSSFDDFVAPVDSSASFAVPPLPAPEVAPAPSAPDPVVTTQTTPIVAVVGGGFAYPVIFLLPLLVAFAVAWTGRAFTRDLAEAAA